MTANETKKVKEITKRLKNYRRDRNTVPYAYYPEEIPAVNSFQSHAEEDIEFLLGLFGIKMSA